jgi:hypothetical protein
MPFAALIVGAVLIVVAFNNTHGQLASELESDIPGYFRWAAAIAAILGLGYVPGLRTPSRWLLALVMVVIVLVNYQAILAGFTNFFGSSGAASGGAAANPSAGYAANPAGAASPDPSAVAGASPGGSVAPASSTAGAASNPAATLAANPFNPSAYLGLIESGFGGQALA